MAEKGGYKHFMLKEIYEQVVTVRDTFRSRIDLEVRACGTRTKSCRWRWPEIFPKICLVGCGTSHHAALVARFWLEELAGILCDVEIASEFRYRRSKKEPGTLVVAITQSGETADTLAAMRDSKAKGPSDHGPLQRGGVDRHPRGGLHSHDALRPGNRRGLDESFHRAS